MALVKERLKVDWTSVNRTAFIDSMIEVQESGVFTDSGFKTAQWTSIMEGFERRTNLVYDKQQLQNQHAELKRKYGIFSALNNNSGRSRGSEKFSIYISTSLMSTIGFPFSIRWPQAVMYQFGSPQLMIFDSCSVHVSKMLDAHALARYHIVGL